MLQCAGCFIARVVSRAFSSILGRNRALCTTFLLLRCVWRAGAKLGALEITADNKQLLRSAYTRRRPEELAVLTRWAGHGEGRA